MHEPLSVLTILFSLTLNDVKNLDVHQYDFNVDKACKTENEIEKLINVRVIVEIKKNKNKESH